MGPRVDINAQRSRALVSYISHGACTCRRSLQNNLFFFSFVSRDDDEGSAHGNNLRSCPSKKKERLIAGYHGKSEAPTARLKPRESSEPLSPQDTNLSISEFFSMKNKSEGSHRNYCLDFTNLKYGASSISAKNQSGSQHSTWQSRSCNLNVGRVENLELLQQSTTK